MRRRSKPRQNIVGYGASENHDGHQLERVTAIISLLVGAVYALLSFYIGGSTKDAAFTALTYGIFISIISSTLILLIEQVRTVPRIKDILQQVQEQQADQKKLLDMLSTDSNRVHELRTHLSSLSPLVKGLGMKVLEDYLESLRTIEDGFLIEGSYWSLKAYESFWQFLVREQNKVGDDEERCLIARITHTNDINIWNPENEMKARLLLLHQEAFIKAGGKIVRILIGTPSNLNDRGAEGYRKAKELMEAKNIEVKYIASKGEDYSYDFAWVENSKYVVKWYSGVGGQALDKCEIFDSVDENVRDMWRTLADRAQKEDSAIESIPASRHMDRYD